MREQYKKVLDEVRDLDVDGVVMTGKVSKEIVDYIHSIGLKIWFKGEWAGEIQSNSDTETKITIN